MVKSSGQRLVLLQHSSMKTYDRRLAFLRPCEIEVVPVDVWL